MKTKTMKALVFFKPIKKNIINVFFFKKFFFICIGNLFGKFLYLLKRWFLIILEN